MPTFTKSAIKASFLKLLEEMPLSKITVKGIVEDCGINRNSFYYYYKDIPALIEDLTREAADRMLTRFPSVDSFTECLDVVVAFVLEHRRIAVHIYSSNSANREMYERYLWRTCEYAVTTYFTPIFSGRRIGERDRQIILRHYKCLCYGYLADWIERGMRTDVREDFRRIAALKRGQIEELLDRCEAEP